MSGTTGGNPGISATGLFSVRLEEKTSKKSIWSQKPVSPYTHHKNMYDEVIPSTSLPCRERSSSGIWAPWKCISNYRNYGKPSDFGVYIVIIMVIFISKGTYYKLIEHISVLMKQT